MGHRMAKKAKGSTRKRDPKNKADPKNIKPPVEPRGPKKERPNSTPAEELIRDGKRLDVASAVYDPAPPLAKSVPPVVETKKVLYLCIAENSFCNKTLEAGGNFGRGQIVDLGKLLKDGSELRAQVRINCFKPIGAGGE